jgi:hypothetical protein
VVEDQAKGRQTDDALLRQTRSSLAMVLGDFAAPRRLAIVTTEPKRRVRILNAAPPPPSRASKAPASLSVSWNARRQSLPLLQAWAN